MARSFSQELGHWLASPTPLMSWERRWVRRQLLRWQDPGFRASLYDVLFWITTAGIIFAGVYLWSSTECALGRECFIANADLANWLLGKK